LNCIKTFNF